MSKTMKEICKHLYYNSCYYRHPKSDFEKAIGKECIDILVKKGYLKDSPKIKNIRDFDEPCYEFSRKFRLIFNYYTNTLWEFIKYYIFFDTIEYLSEKFKY